VLGILRARIARQRMLRSVLEMLAVGGLASGAAYGIGLFAQWLI
jgi:hypothetical protein